MGNIEAVKQQIKGNSEEAITRQPLQPPSPTTDRRSEFPPTVLALIRLSLLKNKRTPVVDPLRLPVSEQIY